MDLAYWGFRHWPFQRTYASEQFLFSRVNDEAVARLLYLIEESRPLGLLTGPKGTGKTFLLKILQRRALRLGRVVVHCEATGIDDQELIGQIADGCSVSRPQNGSAEQTWIAMRKKLEALALVNQSLLIVIDHLDSGVTNCQQTIVRLLQLAASIGARLTILAATRGNDLPAALLEAADLQVELCPWTLEESCQFVNTSVERAGQTGQIFTDEALLTVYEITAGIPAQVMSLSNIALLAAQGLNETLITSELVAAAASELPSRSNERRAAVYGIRK